MGNDRESRTVVSWKTMLLDNEFRNDHLKLCYLWFDEVMFETVGEYDQDYFFDDLLARERNTQDFIYELTDVIVPLGLRCNKDVLGDWRDGSGRGYPRWGDAHENYSFPEPETSSQFAHNVLLSAIESEHGVERFVGWQVEHAEGRARIAVEAVELWSRVNAAVPCMLQSNNDERLAMAAASQFIQGGKELPVPLELAQATIPSLSSVPWAEIAKFRRANDWSELRNKFMQAYTQGGADLNRAIAELCNMEAQAIDSIVDDARPKVGRVVIESLLGLLPFSGINPIEVLSNATATVREIKKARNTGWFYLLRDIKASASKLE